MGVGFLRRRGGAGALALAAAAALAPAGPAGAAEAADPVEHGRTLAELNCARCHATGPEGESPAAGAPPFRTLKTKYPVDTLAESLAEGIETGHADMPEFAFESSEIEDLLAYLRTL